MSNVASLIADMVRAGVDPDIIGRTADAIASASREAPAPRTARQERNHRYYEKRKASENRLNKTDQDGLSPSPEVSPHTPLPNPNPEIPPSPPKGGSSPTLADEFDEFWAIYPNKIGKRKADEAFRKARKRADFAAIMAGLRSYVAKTDDRPWCNPATWLNQDRWTDAPAVSSQAPQQPPVEDETRWLTRLRWAREKRQWSTAEWGPMPGQPNCRAPPHLLEPGDGDGWNELERAA